MTPYESLVGPLFYGLMDIEWRGLFTNQEINALHAEAFDTPVFEDWDWVSQVQEHSLGWVTARQDDGLVGFTNVLWDGLVHAWLQDVMVALTNQHRGTGTDLIGVARTEAQRIGCEYLHVDFDASLSDFYINACGFSPTSAGIMEL